MLPPGMSGHECVVKNYERYYSQANKYAEEGRACGDKKTREKLLELAREWWRLAEHTEGAETKFREELREAE